MGALSLNGSEVFKKGFEPLLPDCLQVPFNDLPALEAALRGNDVAAFIVEPIQGKGVYMPADDYLPEALKLCRKHGTLFIADEIQTGLGRTGRFLALRALGRRARHGAAVEGAVRRLRAGGRAADQELDLRQAVRPHGPRPGPRLHLQQERPGAWRPAWRPWSVIENEKLVARAEALGDGILDDFRAMRDKYELVKDVRGKGLMIGIEFGAPKSLTLKATWSLLETASKGLFCQMVLIPLFKDHKILCQVSGPGVHIIKLLPALVIGDRDRAWIRNAFDAAIADCHRVPGAVWDLGRNLATHAIKSRAGRAA